jgi:hypothetical protein
MVFIVVSYICQIVHTCCRLDGHPVSGAKVGGGGGRDGQTLYAALHPF